MPPEPLGPLCDARREPETMAQTHVSRPRAVERGPKPCPDRRKPSVYPCPHRRADRVGYTHGEGGQVRRSAGPHDRRVGSPGGRARHRQGRRRRRSAPRCRAGSPIRHRCRDHDRRHRVHRPRRHARSAQAAVREGDRRLLHRLPHDLLPEDRRPPPSSRAPAAASRGGTYIFCLPGSPGACRDGWDGILKWQLDNRHRPCNFVEIMPRLEEHRKG